MDDNFHPYSNIQVDMERTEMRSDGRVTDGRYITESEAVASLRALGRMGDFERPTFGGRAA